MSVIPKSCCSLSDGGDKHIDNGLSKMIGMEMAERNAVHLPVCPGLVGTLCLHCLAPSRGCLGGLPCQVEEKCDIVTQKRCSGLGGTRGMLEVDALPGSGAGPPFIHWFIHSTVSNLLWVSLSLVWVVGLPHKHVYV